MSSTERLVEYIMSAIDKALPDEVAKSAKHHLLDTLAACVSGRCLPAGVAGANYVRNGDAAGDSVVIGRRERATPSYAALANAMAAHADESDDTHELSKSHPGCSIVPTALAVAQANGSSGTELLRAIVLGYDVGPRINMALWPSFDAIRSQRRGTPGIAGMFGSASAAAALRRLDEQRVRYLLSYVAQQVSGMNTWKRDLEHIEKSYVMGGWPSFGAFLALSIVEAGWTGVNDVFSGDPNFFDVVGADPEPERMVEELGTRFEIVRTHIKRHAVGSPGQAPIQCLLAILTERGWVDSDLERIEVTLPAVLAHTVQKSRSMPDINLQYLLATVVADGDFTFAAAHDHSRFNAWNEAGGDDRIVVIPDERMAPKRQAEVVVTSVTGESARLRLTSVLGSPDNPMTSADVVAKATGLILPVLGAERAAQICDVVLALDTVNDLSALTSLLESVD